MYWPKGRKLSPQLLHLDMKLVKIPELQKLVSRFLRQTAADHENSLAEHCCRTPSMVPYYVGNASRNGTRKKSQKHRIIISSCVHNWVRPIFFLVHTYLPAWWCLQRKEPIVPGRWTHAPPLACCSPADPWGCSGHVLGQVQSHGAITRSGCLRNYKPLEGDEWSALMVAHWFSSSRCYLPFPVSSSA